MQIDRKFLIQWNNRYPLDRGYRKKYNISFNSPQHRALSQWDIYMEWFEDRLYDEALQEATDHVSREEDLKKGIWLREAKLDEDTAMDIFDKIDITSINEDSPIQFER